MPLVLSDQDLNELNNEIMGDMRGRELRLLANFIQTKINRQQQEQSIAVLPPTPHAESPKPNGHAHEEQPAAS